MSLCQGVFSIPYTVTTARKSTAQSLHFSQSCCSLFEFQCAGCEELNLTTWEIPESHHLLPHQPEGDVCGRSWPWLPNKAKAVLEMETQLHKHTFPFQRTMCVVTVSWMHFNFELTSITHEISWSSQMQHSYNLSPYVALKGGCGTPCPFPFEKLHILKFSPWKITAFLTKKNDSTIFRKAPTSLKKSYRPSSPWYLSNLLWLIESLLLEECT